MKRPPAGGSHATLNSGRERIADWSGVYPTRNGLASGDRMGRSTGTLRVFRGGMSCDAAGGTRYGSVGWIAQCA